MMPSSPFKVVPGIPVSPLLPFSPLYRSGWYVVVVGPKSVVSDGIPLGPGCPTSPFSPFSP